MEAALSNAWPSASDDDPFQLAVFTHDDLSRSNGLGRINEERCKGASSLHTKVLKMANIAQLLFALPSRTFQPSMIPIILTSVKFAFFLLIYMSCEKGC